MAFRVLLKLRNANYEFEQLQMGGEKKRVKRGSTGNQLLSVLLKAAVIITQSHIDQADNFDTLGPFNHQLRENN